MAFLRECLSNMTQPSSSEPSYFKRSLRFLFDYFLHSENKWRARFLFIGSTLCILAITGLGFALAGWCFPLIFGAFIIKDLPLLAMGVGAGILIAGAIAALSYLTNFLKNKLYIEWRTWLTRKIINQYLKSKTNYLEISRIYKDLDNPEQRIQEDIDKAVESSLDLSLGFIDNFTNLSVYIVLLGVIGGSLSFVLFGVPIIIPGYLILVALLAGGTTSLIGYFINKSLREFTNEEVTLQSNLRADLQQLNKASEEIAIEHAEKYYQGRLQRDVDELNIKTTNRLSVQNGTNTFNQFNSIIQVIVPIIASAPLYFKDLITLDAYYSCGYYFAMVTRSLNWFIDSFEKVNKFNTSLGRIIELQTVLDKNNDSEVVPKINRTITRDSKNLEVRNLDIKLHDHAELVIKGLNLKFTPGVHTLIQAPSGTGKSSLFKVIAGTWLAGEGEIIIPHSLESIYFLPQKPSLPDDTLRQVLYYPDADGPYSDAELITALKAVNMEAITNKLDEKIGFKSLGEQQRIAFARVLLRKPDWVFLDEATASLDERGEEDVYSRIKELLPDTTIISIAHRSTVKRYHNNILFFRLNDKKEVHVEEENLSSLRSYG